MVPVFWLRRVRRPRPSTIGRLTMLAIQPATIARAPPLARRRDTGCAADCLDDGAGVLAAAGAPAETVDDWAADDAGDPAGDDCASAAIGAKAAIAAAMAKTLPAVPISFPSRRRCVRPSLG